VKSERGARADTRRSTAAPRFAQLRELRDRLNRDGFAMDTLSMGMSADLEAAIAEGATLYGWVRLFLERGETDPVMRITFIGGGNMADALIGGLLRKDFPLQDIRVVEIRAEARRKLVDKYGVTSVDKTQGRGAGERRVVVFAVKPQHLREAAAKSGIADNANLVISIAAGVRLANLSKWLKGHTRLVRGDAQYAGDDRRRGYRPLPVLEGGHPRGPRADRDSPRRGRRHRLDQPTNRRWTR